MLVGRGGIDLVTVGLGLGSGSGLGLGLGLGSELGSGVANQRAK